MTRRKPPLVAVPSSPDRLVNLLLTYLDVCRARHASRSALKSIEHRLRRFLEWAEALGVLRAPQLDKKVLHDYALSLYEYRRKDTQNPLSFETQLPYLTCLRTFLRWLKKRRHIVADLAEDVKLPRIPQRVPNFLTNLEVENIFANLDTSYGLGIRNRAMIEILYSAGIRRQELLELRIPDVDLDHGTLRIRHGKGQKERVVPLGRRAIAWLDKYLTEVRPLLEAEPDPGAMFLSRGGGALSDSTLNAIVKEALTQAGIHKRGLCHLFRHGMATAMLDAGADIRQIQKILGHASLISTQRYTQVSIEKLKEVHKKTHPAQLEQKPEPDDDD